MDLDAIKGSPLGSLVPISGTDPRTGEHYDHFAFLPTPLPTDLSLSSATWTIVARAEAALARLDQAAQEVPEPALLRRPAIRREAQSTSALEGTYAPFEEVLESDIEDRGHLSLEVREILNYVDAAEEGFAWVRERPLTGGLIAALQGTLVKGTPSQHRDSGRLRDIQVVVGPRTAPVVESRFVPPPPGDQLRGSFEDWVRWVGTPPADLSPVVRAALAHYQFETVHPFSDGNGRIGRLLIVLQLMRDEVLTEPILVVSPWFEARRTEYQDRLLELSRTGDWDEWVGFFAEGVAAAADTTRERVEQLFKWRDETLMKVRQAGISGVAERVAAELIGAPVLRAAHVKARHDVTHQGAMNALRRLAALGILEERMRDGRVSFIAPTVVTLLSR